MNQREQAIEALKKAKANASGCTCSEAYKSRDMADPDCASCEFHEVMQCVDAALSALSEPGGEAPVEAKALTDEEIERLARAFGDGRNLAGSDMALESMTAWEMGARHARDNGYLAPAPAPTSYAMSRDYEALYQHLRNGGEALGEVDHWVRDHVLRNPVKVWQFKEWWYISNPELVKSGTQQDAFLAECQRLNLEWLAPLSADRIMEVVEKAREDHDNIEWRSPPASYNAEFRRLLRSRLSSELGLK